MKDVPKDIVISVRYEKELEEKKKRLAVLRTELAEAQRRLDLLKGEIVKCLEGKSDFTSEMLSGLITEAEASRQTCQAALNAAQEEISQSEQRQRELSRRYDELISWSELYDGATIAQKKMIVNSMIARLDVFRGYDLKVEFAFDIRQFFEGLDSTGKSTKPY